MKNQFYSVEIVKNGQVVPEDGAYVQLHHNDEYAIRLGNNSTRRCSAAISIDGKPVGTFIVSPYRPTTIERHADIARKFTFYKLGSVETQSADLENDDSLGLVSVTFVPEKVQPQPAYLQTKGLLFTNQMFGGETTRSAKGIGGTGLGSHSSQQFTSVEFEESNERYQIHIRLEAAPEIVAIPKVISTPVPPRR